MEFSKPNTTLGEDVDIEYELVKFCSNCGKERKLTTDKFCSNCGKKFELIDEVDKIDKKISNKKLLFD